VGHLVTEGAQVIQSGPALHIPVLTAPDHLVVLYLARDGAQDDLLHNIPWHWLCSGYNLLWLTIYKERMLNRQKK